MAITYKVLGQTNPAANTANNLYTVPAATSAIISTISVCNQSTSAGTFKLAVRPAGATLSMQLYRSLTGEVTIGKWIIRLSDGKATQEAIRIAGNKLGRRDCNDGFRKPIQILVTEIESGTVSQWNSSEEFASSLNVSKNTLQKHLWVNNSIWKNQFRVEYLRT